MSSVDPTLNDIDNDDPRGLRDFAEREAQRANAATQELASLRKKDGFRDAGLDPTNPLHKAVIDGYAGEQDGIKDFVTGLGLNTAANTAPPEPAIPVEEQEALNRMNALNSGDGGAGSVHPEADGNARLKAIRDQAVNEKWGPARFNAEFTAEMERQRRPVANMDVVR